MRLLFVSPRWGEQIAGGAEAALRQLAERLAARGHDVEAVSSRAVDYRTWTNELPAATTTENGVVVHRLSVAEPRDIARFDEWNERLIVGAQPVPLEMQERWLLEQGPVLTGLDALIRDRAPDVDLLVTGPYLYASGVQALRSAAAVGLPRLLHPKAHQEPTLSFSLYDTVLRTASGFSFNTPEEECLVRRRFGLLSGRPSAVIGLGVDTSRLGQPERFRGSYGLGNRPYLLLLGRVDAAKGSSEALEMFRAFRQRHPDFDLRLVVVGRPTVDVHEEPDVIYTGFVDEDTKTDALAGCLALLQPSYYESFSLVLAEAWTQGRPAIVQGANDVLVGQVTRAGGGIPYRGYAEFEAAVEHLVEQPATADALGAGGRAYVAGNYTWSRVLDRYENLMEIVITGSPRTLG